jgi:hypothetical protein
MESGSATGSTESDASMSMLVGSGGNPLEKSRTDAYLNRMAEQSAGMTFFGSGEKWESFISIKNGRQP